jgi:uncharacterized membrane protein HdeD (DUF308 family)
VSTTKSPNTPSRRDRLRPWEYVGMAAIIAIFIGLVVFGSTRQIVVALVFFGVAFIVSLVVIAMLSLAVKPDELEQSDMLEQDKDDRAPTPPAPDTPQPPSGH